MSTGPDSAIKPLILADLIDDEGRHDLASGAVATVQGVAIALSNVLAGGIVDAAGFTAALLVSAGLGAASGLLLTRMPEPSAARAGRRAARPAQAAPKIVRPRPRTTRAASRCGPARRRPDRAPRRTRGNTR